MANQVKRLLITEKPYPNESFIGYLVRLAELNAIPDFRWLYKLIFPKKIVRPPLNIKSNLMIDNKKLSRLSGINQREINRLLCEDENIPCISCYDLIIHDQLIRTHYMDQGIVRICPACLKEENYCRRIWEFSPLVICPYHRCLLINQCPQCFQQLSWQRPGISICKCQFDLRHTGLTLVDDEGLRFGRYLCTKLRFLLPESKFELEYPLNSLNIDDLLRLTLYVSRQINIHSEFSLRYTLSVFPPSLIHKLFCEVVEVFCNWSENYHLFIEKWQETAAHCKSSSRFDKIYNPIPLRYKKYERLIWELDKFEGDKFEFLHCEFLNYLNSSRNEIVQKQ